LSKIKDETGNRYGMLTVLRPYKVEKGSGMVWICRCDCGMEVAVPGIRLRRGMTKSCGCLRAMPFDQRAALGYWPGENKERKEVEGTANG
jgi:hypothetical protein